SYIGYKTKEVAVNGNETVNVKLEADATSLSEVVVVGYGTARKKDLTGSVAVVGVKDFQKGTISTPEQMISGKVPGVSIVSNSGQPGSGSTIRIRGGSSLNASNDPLFVIDGVVLDNSSISGASNPLSFINPNDIETFTVLKDASAAAIYGARAANGVIIITTKKGNNDQFKVTANSVNAVSSITKYVDVLNADQFRAIVTESGNTEQKARLGTVNTDWQQEIYQTGIATDNNIGLSGGIKIIPYRVSVGYQNINGILRTDKLQKTSLALVLNPTFFDKHLKVDVNLKGSMQKARFPNTGAIGAAVSFDPSQPILSGNQNYGGYFEYLDPTSPTGLYALQGRNPMGLLNQRIDKSSPQRSIGNVQLDYKFHFLPELRANLNLGYDVATGKGTVFVPEYAASNFIAGGAGGLNNQYKQNRKNTLLDFYLNYVKDVKSLKSRIDLTAGYSYNDYNTKNFNFASFNAKGEKLVGTTDPTFPFNEFPKYRLISYFGRANYNFDDRYLLTATLRRDGSSRFGPSNQFALFPSVALAWSAKNEGFLKNNNSISTLKFRLGYGATGQQDFGSDFGYLANYSLSQSSASYQFGNEYYLMYRPSGYVSTIKWEESTTTNLAMDYGFMNNRINGTIEVYHKKTKDLLALAPQAAGTNFSATAFQNIGNMENRGVEFNINVQPVLKDNFTWNAGFNITYNKNKITNLTLVPNDPNYLGSPTGPIAGGIGGQFTQLNAVGGSKSTFNLYQQVYDESGAPIDGVFVDRNGDGVITPSDVYLSKSSDPKVFLGYSNSITYKKWSTSFVLRANLGNYVYNNTFSQTGTLKQITGSAVAYNASTNYLDTKFTGSSIQALSDYYIQNASFLKMDNFNIGYNAGKFFNQKVSLQLSAIVQNVFVITKYKGLDPEISSGIDNNFYPRPRVFSVGLNLNY
ncbi:MAG: SusC/RagA family TonB-linked outer membrane protein, partial [Daejeonella sp.]|nr:SusC/RagA family TonB-linked outer membrane protein [Daejeonella sp.]